MFAAGVPECIIQEVTGHCSIKALRSYERTSTEQLGNVAEVLAAKENKQFDWNLKPESKLPAREALTDRNMGGNTFLNCTVTVVVRVSFEAFRAIFSSQSRTKLGDRLLLLYLC